MVSKLLSRLKARSPTFFEWLIFSVAVDMACGVRERTTDIVNAVFLRPISYDPRQRIPRVSRSTQTNRLPG
jgi:hypothetical protein